MSNQNQTTAQTTDAVATLDDILKAAGMSIAPVRERMTLAPSVLKSLREAGTSKVFVFTADAKGSEAFIASVSKAPGVVVMQEDEKNYAQIKSHVVSAKNKKNNPGLLCQALPNSDGDTIAAVFSLKVA